MNIITKLEKKRTKLKKKSKGKVRTNYYLSLDNT